MNLLYTSAEQRQHFDTIFKRAATDSDYRRRLLQQPKKTVEETTGVKLPEKFNVQFIETPKGIDLLVPIPELIDDEVSLTEDELETVAGGVTDPEWCCGACSDCSGCSQCSAATGA